MATSLGITSPLGTQPAVLLGGTSDCCTVLDMTTAYATLAAMGMRHEPHLVARIEDRDGTTIWEPPGGQLVLDEVVAHDTIDLLRRVVSSGTGRLAAIPGHDVAGKTGTTTDNVDGWFVGATPELTTGVWVGHHDGRRTAWVDGRRLQGGRAPAQIFATHMREVLDDGPGPRFTLPDHRQVTVEVDVETGLRPAPWCPETELRTFADTRTPTETCPSPRPPPSRPPSPAPTPTSTPSPDGSPSPGPSPDPSSSPSPTPSPTPTGPAPSPTPSPSPPAPSPDPTPTPDPEPPPEPATTPDPTPAPSPSAEPTP
jgi:membrane peptidoglycan carboxypeptidase